MVFCSSLFLSDLLSIFLPIIGSAWDQHSQQIFYAGDKNRPKNVKSVTKYRWFPKKTWTEVPPRTTQEDMLCVLVQDFFFFLSFKLPRIPILKLIWRQKILPSQSHCSILPKLALDYSCTDFRCSEPERLFLLLNSNHILGLSPVWDLVVDNSEDSCWSRRGETRPPDP